MNTTRRDHGRCGPEIGSRGGWRPAVGAVLALMAASAVSACGGSDAASRGKVRTYYIAADEVA